MKTVYAVLTEQLDGHASVISEALCSGSASDYAEYKYLCGQYRGLLLSKNLISDLAKAQEEEYDND
jgi:hypothetical protein